MVLANFFWAAVFFGIATVMGVVMVRKLPGRWRLLVPGVALAVAVATSFCMMGQYCIDRGRAMAYLYRLPIVGRPRVKELDALARALAAGTPEVKAWLGDIEMVLDTASVEHVDLNLTPSRVLLSYLTKESEGPRRLYILCNMPPGGQWYVLGAYHKVVVNGEIVETTLWSAQDPAE